MSKQLVDCRDTQPKAKKGPPHRFVLDALESVSPETRPMFGCLAVYVGQKIVLILRDKRDGHADDGVWLATTELHHASLRPELPSMRSVQVFRKVITGWQVLPVVSADFESAALHACQLIIDGDPRIGKVPKPKRRKARQ